jgi:hypothetical protein
MPGAIDGTGADVGDTWDGSVFSKPAKTLQRAKQEAREAIIHRWAKAEGDGLAFQTKRIETDTDNISRIGVLARRARQAKDDGQPFPVSLIAADETVLNLTRAEILLLDTALGDHFKACSDNARTLRQAVTAAATVAAVEAINIEAGWPA